MSDPTPPRAPTPLLLAALLVALQGAGLVALAVVGLADLVSSRIEVGVSVSVFFALYGVALAACAWALTRRRGWARGPVMLTQLIQLGIAWNAREHALLAVPLAVTALVALVAMVQPASIEALLGVPDEESA
ncbi:hypothetical protein [Nocardioides plantarum]|uniref:MFS transporter n=1 Tax=Nocardioides plantarum TaxID=29299 RepID=A0ABV5K9G1_9ACTN|nr:hypothetical protein [Nocardioides plantarum]